MILRPYQSAAIEAVNAHFAEKETNPLVVIPTAGGKTIVFASLIQQWMTHPQWPAPRVCVLAHVKELLSQAEAKILSVWPKAPVGVWSAGLNRKEGSRQITVASIQSIYKKAFDFEPFDVLIVDEAHLIPIKGEGMYRRFIKDCRLANPNLRVLGFTATPYRLGGGHIAAPSRILNEVCYDAKIGDLIGDGYLCKLRSKATEETVNVDGLKIQNGDFVASALEARVNTDQMVSGAVSEMVRRGRDRKSWLVFCCGVAHAYRVSDELSRHGVDAPVITGDTHSDERAAILARFDAGELRAVCNVNTLTTGLDVTRIDLIALLRPTQSTSLYIQMVGRGFRLHPNKDDCLVLDFGGNVRRHGPVDAIVMKPAGIGPPKNGEAPTKTCPVCEEIVHAGVLECPSCHHQFPPREVKHEAKADTLSILTSAEPWEVKVTRVTVDLHEKEGRPNSLQVTYYGDGLSDRHREWICLEHSGYPHEKAVRWWSRRFGESVPATAKEAVGDMFLGHKLTQITESITVKQNGRYTEVINANLRSHNATARTVFA